ncbi:MAG: hypothetical protein ACK4VI_01215 [Alphaproteobacteria bacterium]
MIIHKKNYLGLIFCLLALLSVFVTQPNQLHAQEYSIDREASQYFPNILDSHVPRHEMLSRSNVELPHEPMIKEVRFTKQDPPRTINERIERLVHGVLHDIPPTYDHYGYEIRRYMKSILTPHDLNDSLHIIEKLRQARTARIILDYWRKELQNEMAEIEKAIEASQTTTSMITMFRHNSGIINKFIPDLYMWIDRNIEFLEYLQSINGEYYVNYPFYEFSRSVQERTARDLYTKREQGLRAVIEYAPFRGMIY